MPDQRKGLYYVPSSLGPQAVYYQTGTDSPLLSASAEFYQTEGIKPPIKELPTVRDYYAAILASRPIAYDDWQLMAGSPMEVEIAGEVHRGILKGLDDTVVSSPSGKPEKPWLVETPTARIAFHPLDKNVSIRLI